MEALAQRRNPILLIDFLDPRDSPLKACDPQPKVKQKSAGSSPRIRSILDRTVARDEIFKLHVSPVLAAHIVQRMTDLTEGVVLDGFEESFEEVGAGAGCGLEVGEGAGG